MWDFLELQFEFQFLKYCFTSAIFFLACKLWTFYNLGILIIFITVKCASSVSKYFMISFINMLINTWTKTTPLKGLFVCVVQLDIRFSPYFTQKVISCYIIFVQLTVFMPYFSHFKSQSFSINEIWFIKIKTPI
jgi:hypothetical protein